jgi:carbamoyl-phosphate synthase/aspartate carbamoyltransferase/dihydroorotase
MTTLQLPGLVDVHTHLRVPGGEHKEDFSTGTAAALAGGITMVLAMPNTNPPLTTVEALKQARETARGQIRCDVGLFAGASAEDLDQLPHLGPDAAALKIYLNDTFGKLRVDEVPTLVSCFQHWPRKKLIALHAEKQSVAVALGLAAVYDRPVHFCHISRREEIELIADAKEAGLPVTCEVTPHHLFLNQEDAARLGALGDMRPVLGTPDDVSALWEHLNSTVDCIATDHAPHTLEEKEGDPPPPGVPGLQTSLSLMLTAVADGLLSLERLVELMNTNPRRIYGLPEQPDTYVLVDPDVETTITNEEQLTRCGWTPFAGRRVTGRVERVVLRGDIAYDAGKVLARAGDGRLLP